MNEWVELIRTAVLLLAGVFLLGLVILLVMGVVLYVRDRNQSRHAILRNYPVIGRFRYWFEHLGEFFRQYFFALDRAELPFNRAQRGWVYRAAKNLDSTVAFGSTNLTRGNGALVFVNDPYPALAHDFRPPSAVVIGPNCLHPFETSSIFNVSGMSFGAISRPAVQALSRGAAKAGCWVNTGEGGVSPYHLEGGCDLVVQIGTAKYGVRDAKGALSDERLKELAALEQVKMFELKLAQGAKPGKGGILPGIKVTEEIARIRGIPVGEDSISPNGHLDIRSDEELLQMLQRIRHITGKPVGFKTVLGSEQWLDKLFSTINRLGSDSAPDFITLDSGDGGTGAAPQSLMDYMGMTINESLPLLVDKLHEYGLRERVKVIASGKLINPADVAWALCLGADFVTSARGFMFALGCIQAMQCNRNTCPTGVTTHNPRLQQGLVPTDKAERVFHYARNLIQEVGIIAHSCGVHEPRQLRRRHVRLVENTGRSQSLDLIYPPVAPRVPD